MLHEGRNYVAGLSSSNGLVDGAAVKLTMSVIESEGLLLKNRFEGPDNRNDSWNELFAFGSS